MIRITAALAFVALTALATPALAQDARLPRALSLTGHGEVRARPDLAVVNIGVTNSAASAREALDANNKSMGDILAALEAARIERKDVQTSNFSVAPRYDYGLNADQRARVVGYDVSNAVAVTLRKLDRLGPLLDAMVGLGSNQINGIMFALDDPEPRRDEARRAAVADAKRKATLYGAAVGVTLGNVLSISEAAGLQPPVPVFTKAARMDAAEGAGSVPVAEGEQLIGVDVSITWEIK